MNVWQVYGIFIETANTLMLLTAPKLAVRVNLSQLLTAMA